MTLSSLSEYLLSRAKEIQREHGIMFLSTPCIIMAAVELCKNKYTGITQFDEIGFPKSFEEERLRYCVDKVFRLSGYMAYRSIMRIVKRNPSRYCYNFFEKYCETLGVISKNREKDKVYADLLLLVAVADMPLIHRRSMNAEYRSAFSIEDLLSEVDENIYDYVLDSIKEAKKELEKKEERVLYQKNWKPAEKIAEPDDITEWIFKNVNVLYGNKTLGIRIMDFFGERGGLILSIRYSDGIYRISDNGCALKVLWENCGTDEKYKRVLERIGNYFTVDNDGAIVYEFSQERLFFYYLQSLMMAANGDLYYEHFSGSRLLAEIEFGDTKSFVPEEFDANALLEELKNSFIADYDSEWGVYLVIKMTYSLGDTYTSYLFKGDGNGTFKICDDKRNEYHSEIFENLSFLDDDFTPYNNLIQSFCRRFSAEFDGRDISATIEGSGGREFVRRLFEFINLAVLSSELGRLIEV